MKFFLGIFMLLLATTSLRAGLPVVFQMDGCIGDASLIVRGFLDKKGNLDSSEVFKGSPPAQQLAIMDGEKIYHSLLAGMKESSAISSNAVEVVAFLKTQTKDGWQPDIGNAGVAGLDGTNVFLFGLGKGIIFDGHEMPVGLDKYYTRESFLSAIKEEVRLDDQLDALCVLPHTARNIQNILAFILEHDGWYHQRRIVESLRPIAHWAEPINAELQSEVLKKIANTVDATNKCVLLGLAADLHLSKEAFDPIAPLIETNQPPVLRRTAMETLQRIDRHETMVLLLPLITLKEPELFDVLNTLQFEDPTMDLKMTDALLSLSREMRQQETQTPHPASFNEEWTLRTQLARHVDPGLVSFYFDWLLQREPTSPSSVVSCLQAMLGVNWERSQLESWWDQHRKIIETTYKLQEDAGRNQWFSAYQDADDVTKHFLVRLWMLTPEANQIALVKAATEQKTAVMAKATITELWDGKHLGNEAIQEMFENFMRVEFVDAAKDFTNRFKYQHNLEIILKFDYPFNTCIYIRHPIALDGNIDGHTMSQSQLCPEPSLKEYPMGCIGGYVPGQVATGTLEVYQRENYPDGKELWHAQWNLGPIQLGE